MKKKCLAILTGGILLLGLTACGGDEVKVVNKVPGSGAQNQEDTAGEETPDDAGEEALTGYIYEVEVNGKTVSVTTDVEMKGILNQLGEPVSYFESASCAFKGLDKVYTYDHFRIETYPDEEKDIISTIIFLDDIEETKEGISIGMTKEEMENAYGTEYEEKDGMTVYTKDGKHLSFLVKDGVIESIEYNSAVLDNVEAQ